MSQYKTWFITGAARGFGLRIAQQALARGDRVVATARNVEQLSTVLGASPKLLVIALDVRHEGQVKLAVAQALSHFGNIDVVVNNAGYGLLGAIEETTSAEIQALYETNVFGVLSVCRAVLPTMRARRSGHIINISSVGGYAARAGWGIYNSTKFAVEGFSEALYFEAQPLGINVTILEPGLFRTDFLDGSSLASTSLQIADYAETVGAMRSGASAGNRQQPGDPAKLAQAVLQLADSAAPPLRLQLGTDCVARVREKNARVEAEMQEWIALATSTNFS